jgi:hypothetical protein
VKGDWLHLQTSWSPPKLASTNLPAGPLLKRDLEVVADRVATDHELDLDEVRRNVDLSVDGVAGTADRQRVADQDVASAEQNVDVSIGLVPENARSMWQMDSVQVLDGGPDGLVNTTPNGVFAVPGVFAP